MWFEYVLYDHKETREYQIDVEDLFDPEWCVANDYSLIVDVPDLKVAIVNTRIVIQYQKENTP